MHRRYRPWHYAEKVGALLDAAGPDLTLGADVMVGFPGGPTANFAETCQLIRDLPFGYLHLFPFSPRPGTSGWALHSVAPVSSAVVDERMAKLRSIAEQKVRAHRSQFLGRSVTCITLHTSPAVRARGRTAALSENFLPLEIVGEIPANRLATLHVTNMESDSTLLAYCHA